MLERGAGNDPATSCLASKRSPTELPPHARGAPQLLVLRKRAEDPVTHD